VDDAGLRIPARRGIYLSIENEIKSCLTMPTPRVLDPEYDEPPFAEPLGLISEYARILINTLLVVIIQRSRRADRIYEVEIIE